MLPVRFAPPALKYFKKLRDKKLKGLFHEAIDVICKNPEAGQRKKGDLAGVYGYDIYYRGTNYELAYTVEKLRDGSVVVVILAGTRENFYEQLKRYWP